MVIVNRIKAHLAYNPSKHKEQLLSLKNDMHDAIAKSEESHACEIVFVVEETLSLAWLFTSVQRRANFMFKKMKIHKLPTQKGILIYLELLDKQLEVRIGDGVSIPKENWDNIIVDGLKMIDTIGIHKGCLWIVQKITDELIKYEPCNIVTPNIIQNDLIVQ